MNITSVGAVSFTIVPGTPYTLFVRSSRTTWVSGVVSSVVLDPVPELVIIDAAGNMITERRSLPLSIRLYFINSEPVDGNVVVRTINMSASVTDGSTYLFTGVSVRSQFGRQVQLRFSADGVQVPITVELPQEACTASEYAVSGSFSCAPCPANADCDGSSKVVSHRGYWRSSLNSVVMYECTPADACPASVSCAPGYTGAVCGSCAAGYGSNGAGCGPCASTTVNWIVTAAVLVGLGIAIYTLSIHTVVFTAVEDLAVGLAEEIHDDAHFVSVVVKLVLSHIQTISLIPPKSLQLPEWFVDFFIRTPSSKPSVSYVACAVGGSPYHQMLSQLALIPILMMGVGLAAFVRAFAAHRKYLSNARLAQAQMHYSQAQRMASSSRVEFKLVDHAAILLVAPTATDKDHRVLRNAHAELLEWYKGDLPQDIPSTIYGTEIPGPPPIYVRMLNLCAVTIIVVLFFVYPTLVQTSMQALRCRSIDIGLGLGSYSVLTADPQTHCTDSDETYTATRSLAIFVIVFVGVGVLFAAPAIIAWTSVLTCKSNRQHTNQLFFFTTGGYRLWYWESVAMGRKAAIALALALADDGQQQFIPATLISMIFTFITMQCQPWSHIACSHLDVVSQVALSCSLLCLGLGYAPAIENGQGGTATILALVLVFNIVFFLLAASTAVKAARVRLRYEATTNRVAAALLDTLEGRSTEVMTSAIEGLEKRVQSQKQSLRTCTAKGRGQLLKDMNVRRSKDLAACSLEQSLYGSFYTPKTRRDSLPTLFDQHMVSVNGLSTTTKEPNIAVHSPYAASAPPVKIGLPLFQDTTTAHPHNPVARATNVDSSHSGAELSHSRVVVLEDSAVGAAPLRPARSIGDMSGSWAARSLKSIRVTFDEDEDDDGAAAAAGGGGGGFEEQHCVHQPADDDDYITMIVAPQGKTTMISDDVQVMTAAIDQKEPCVLALHPTSATAQDDMTHNCTSSGACDDVMVFDIESESDTDEPLCTSTVRTTRLSTLLPDAVIAPTNMPNHVGDGLLCDASVPLVAVPPPRNIPYTSMLMHPMMFGAMMFHPSTSEVRRTQTVIDRRDPGAARPTPSLPSPEELADLFDRLIEVGSVVGTPVPSDPFQADVALPEMVSTLEFVATTQPESYMMEDIMCDLVDIQHLFPYADASPCTMDPHCVASAGQQTPPQSSCRPGNSALVVPAALLDTRLNHDDDQFDVVVNCVSDNVIRDEQLSAYVELHAATRESTAHSSESTRVVDNNPSAVIISTLPFTEAKSILLSGTNSTVASPKRLQSANDSTTQLSWSTPNAEPPMQQKKDEGCDPLAQELQDVLRDLHTMHATLPNTSQAFSPRLPHYVTDLVAPPLSSHNTPHNSSVNLRLEHHLTQVYQLELRYAQLLLLYTQNKKRDVNSSQQQ
ncbi:transmembrane protein, putative [Bodo saltans]|uniref:Transmembrane protein, putative n=1 Tax=Bodo saltans TaxID=75058 RepID=A0A0S4J293_BODSA|nr:transmembrane protein, putative [Bodo saltans]|eukprot:CUG84465.1 transmembrane protein, putative [Bodo saltans]